MASTIADLFVEIRDQHIADALWGPHPVHEDIRVWARQRLDASDGIMNRQQYIALVCAYALGKHGDDEDVKRHAERTARHLWDSRPRG